MADDELCERIAALEAENRRLHERLDGVLSALTADAGTVVGEASDKVQPIRASRRSALRLAAAGAVGLAAGAVGGARPAAAADPNDVVKDTANTVAGTTSLRRAAESAQPVLYAASGDDTNPIPGIAQFGSNQGAITARALFRPGVLGVGGSHGVGGIATEPLGSGVTGLAFTAGIGVVGSGPTGVKAISDIGTALVLSGKTHIRFVDTAAQPPPNTEDRVTLDVVGDLLVDRDRTLWYCVEPPPAGFGSRAVWRRLASTRSVGTLQLLASPLRAYDSRPTGPGARNDPKLAADEVRVISLRFGEDLSEAVHEAIPADAAAALLTITATETEGPGGFVRLSAAGTPVPATSVLNWSAANQNVATTTVSALTSGSVQVVGGSHATHLVIDVIGYYG